MTIINENHLKDFSFWSGAVQRAVKLTDDEFDRIENILVELYPDGMSATDINDFFWFDFETIAEWIGTTEEDVLNRE